MRLLAACTLSFGIISINAFAGDLRSPSGTYAVEVDERDGLVFIVVRNLVVPGSIVAIDPNPGGSLSPSFAVRFTAGDNVLASWGCGTYCVSSVLFNAAGKELASLGIHDVSPTGELAVSYTAIDEPIPGDIKIVNLRTGKIIRRTSNKSVWNTCKVRWSSKRVVLEPCDRRTRPVELPTTSERK
jgi:hypothetical protein